MFTNTALLLTSSFVQPAHFPPTQTSPMPQPYFGEHFTISPGLVKLNRHTTLASLALKVVACTHIWVQHLILQGNRFEFIEL
jgi:hypothetical protein